MSVTDTWFCLHGGSWLHQQDAGLPASGVLLYLGAGFAKGSEVPGHSRHPPPLSCNAVFKGFKTPSHLFFTCLLITVKYEVGILIIVIHYLIHYLG